MTLKKQGDNNSSAIFLMISTLFMAGGLRVTSTMISSMKGLNEVAIPPDYLQMHKGDYDAT